MKKKIRPAFRPGKVHWGKAARVATRKRTQARANWASLHRKAK